MAISTSNIKFIAAATIAAAAVAAGSSSLYLYLLHRKLARSTLHVHKSCSGTSIGSAIERGYDKDNEIQPICTTIPDNVLTSDQYLVIYDRAWRILKTESELPSEQALNTTLGGNAGSHEAKLLTAYLRRNMSAFARYLPQARIIKTMIRKSNPEAAQTLNPVFIEKLDFVVGDVVCGIYKVLRREDAVVEFAMVQPTTTDQESKEKEEGSGQGFDGRLVIGMRSVEDSLEVFSETIMWRDTNRKGVVMPLERKVPRVLHELASWWLLDSGVMYLKGLK